MSFACRSADHEGLRHAERCLLRPLRNPEPVGGPSEKVQAEATERAGEDREECSGEVWAAFGIANEPQNPRLTTKVSFPAQLSVRRWLKWYAGSNVLLKLHMLRLKFSNAKKTFIRVHKVCYTCLDQHINVCGCATASLFSVKTPSTTNQELLLVHRVNQEWQYRIACKTMKACEISALQQYLQRSDGISNLQLYQDTFEEGK